MATKTSCKYEGDLPFNGSIEKQSRDYFQAFFKNNTDFVYSTDLEGRLTSVNPAFLKTFECTEREALGKTSVSYFNSKDKPRLNSLFEAALKGAEQTYSLEIKGKTGAQLYQVKKMPIIVEEQIIGTYGIGRNINDQKEKEEKIIQLAYYDHETGLPNRMNFMERLEERVRKARITNSKLAVLILDLDRFKFINDSLGHYAGDFILKGIAGRIKSVIGSDTFMGRFSGDKFIILVEKKVSLDETMNAAKGILKEISKPIVYETKEFSVTASLGISLFPEDGAEENILLKNADVAMNRSKQQGGNRITFFSTEMNGEAMIRLELESCLRKALQKNEFFLCYQPLIDLQTGQISGGEALIRWNHPKLGLVSPNQFIPLAEETGLIEPISQWVIKTACRQTKKWHKKGLGKLQIAVNVAASQFQQPNFVYAVKTALEECQLDPRYLTLELTERTMLRNINYSISVIKSLQKLGVRVSIDDFGTGYSSLSYLKHLPINTLKIDQSFINNLHQEPSDIAIVRAIITMGQGLDVKVVAEGVESKQQIDILKELKCHYAQGFYIQKPVSPTEFGQGYIF
ncbi:sensor domain-containing protein [Mesobacillus harenae]|uniref:sensor domain-containing protein n=1 Tax=Mesobacillus harenae TaxID=2213203 RepID=UPI001580EADC|nr:EAL domain-containing protein [Mesobacillus harenae]